MGIGGERAYRLLVLTVVCALVAFLAWLNFIGPEGTTGAVIALVYSMADLFKPGHANAAIPPSQEDSGLGATDTQRRQTLSRQSAGEYSLTTPTRSRQPSGTYRFVMMAVGLALFGLIYVR
jgi:hypothetical protein